MTNKNLTIFENKEIRRIWHEGQWFFSVIDVVAALTESKDAGAYWRKLKQRLKTSEGSEVVTFCHGLKLEALDGKKYETRPGDRVALIEYHTVGDYRMAHVEVVESEHLTVGSRIYIVDFSMR